MEILNKQQLAEKLGKASFWMPKRCVGLSHYLGGIEPFDEKIDVNRIITVPNIVNFEIHKNGLAISMMERFKLYHTGVENDRIISINLEDKEQVYIKKEKSVVGRAIVGGILFGGVGAIVGGMTGLQESEKKAKMPDLILSIEIGASNVPERVVLFSCKYDKKKELCQFFQTHLPRKFKVL